MELFAEDLKIKLIEEIKKADDPAQEAAEVIEYAITQLNERVEDEIKKAALAKKDEKEDKDEKGEVKAKGEGEEGSEEETGITQEAFDLAVEEARQEGVEEGKKSALESVVEDTSVGKALVAIEAIKQIVLPMISEDAEELAGEGNIYEELESLRKQVVDLTEAKDAATKKAEDLEKERDEAAKAREGAEDIQKKVTEMLEGIDVPAIREKAEALIEKAETVDEGFITVLENFIEVESDAAPVASGEKEEEALTEDMVEEILGEGGEKEEELDEDSKKMMESLTHIAGIVSKPKSE